MKKLLLVFTTILPLYAGDNNSNKAASRMDPMGYAAYYCCCPHPRNLGNPDQANLTQSRSGQNSVAGTHRLSVLNSQLLMAFQGQYNESPHSQNESD